MLTAGEAARRELNIRELERRHEKERSGASELMRHLIENEKRRPFDDNWHYKVISDALNKVLAGEITRLMINVPPGSGKTEEITKVFPVFAMGKKPGFKVISTAYSSNLAQKYGSEARDYYVSPAYRMAFPRAAKIRDDSNTKELWETEEGAMYLSAGTGGSITGHRCNAFIIDDPLKPNEASSDVMRSGVNNWYDNTVLSRLFDPMKDAVIIIMQRTHENDLCGYLQEREKAGTGEEWHKIVLPAIAEVDELPYRKAGEALQKNRYPLESLAKLKLSLGRENFSTQYQQDPVSRESREFHPEWFRDFEAVPAGARVFTAVDPAFSKRASADESAIASVAFNGDDMYVLEVTHGHFDPAELENEIVRHAKVWRPEKIGIEAVQAQSVIGFSLRPRIEREAPWCLVDDIRSTTEKEMRIRRLIPMYARGKVYHRKGAIWREKLEEQLMKFPRGRHDDLPDALQYVMELYTLQPNAATKYSLSSVGYDSYGRPIF